MTAHQLSYIECDSCGQETDLDISAFVVRASAKTKGWRVNVSTPGQLPQDYCPKCSEEQDD